MEALFFTLVLVLVLVLDHTLSGCLVWGQSRIQLISVLDGEVGWLSCPLFSDLSILKSSSSYNLSWSRLPEGDVQEQPLTNSRSLGRDQHRLLLLPASTREAGDYRCTLGNASVCLQATVRVAVLQPNDTVRSMKCEPPVAAATSHVSIPFQSSKVLECPDLQDATRVAAGDPVVTWLYVKPGRYCKTFPSWNNYQQQNGTSLVIYTFYEQDQGFYYCTVQFQTAGRTFRFTRRINVTAVSAAFMPKEPSILRLSHDPAFPVRTKSAVHLVCRALFPHLDSWRRMWWTVDGSLPEDRPDRHRFSSNTSCLLDVYGDRTEESVLVIQDFSSEDLQREFNCSVRNLRGVDTRRAELQLEASPPSVQLGCGLGAALFLMLLLFVVYHVFWLELLLIYRSWFGPKEQDSDNKDYDVYISYARNSEDENFVLSTLRCVLENTFGYSVCIFDRDSLPGGIVNDDTLTFVARSRRLLVVVGPGYGRLGSQALLELKAGIDNMALGGNLRVILVQYRRVRRQGWVKELRRARLALTLIRWQGDRSRELTSRFWKQLRLELPVSPVSLQTGLTSIPVRPNKGSGAAANLLPPPAGPRLASLRS